jgi:hypothetical protein
MGVQDAFDQVGKDNRRRAEVFRKGVIAAVDTSGPVVFYTVSGRRMPSVYALLAVGDIVVYVDQADPFVVGKFSGT